MHGRWQLGLVGMAVVIGACALSYGQETGTTPSTPSSARRSMEGVTEMRMLSEQLNLTPEQKEKLRPIVTEEGDQLHDVRRDQRLRPEQKNAKLLAIREEFAPKIGAVLTPEQQEKWKKIVETWHSKASEGAKDSTAPATPQ